MQKRNSRIIRFFSLLILLSLFFSCQKHDPMNDSDLEGVFTKSSKKEFKPEKTINGKKVVGYVTQWDAWKGPTDGLIQAAVCNQLNIDYSKLTHLHYSFFGVASDGSLMSGDYRNKEIYRPGTLQEPEPLLYCNQYSSFDYWLLYGELDAIYNINDYRLNGHYIQKGSGWINTNTGLTGNQFPILIHKEGGQPGLFELAKANNVKLVAALGGWSMCRFFPQMASNDNMKRTFINSCITLIKIGFDGIDLDWEYPGPFAGMNFTGTSADFENYSVLVEDLRKAFSSLEKSLGRKISISATLSGAPDKLDGFAPYVSSLNNNVDYFNMLTYDFHGGFSERAGHNSPLYSYKNEENTKWSWDGARTKLEQLGIEMSKVNMGVPFYGRSVVSKTSPAKLNDPLHKQPIFLQPDGNIISGADYVNFPINTYAGTPTYNRILQKTADWDEQWDDEAKVPYRVKDNFLLSYDNEKSVGLKAQYVKNQQLGGVCIWNIFGDMDFQSVEGVYGNGKLVKCLVATPLLDKINSTFK